MARGNPRDAKRERAWRRHIRQQQASGLTIRDYCAANGLHESAFYLWRRELAKRQRPVESSAASSEPAFAAVRLVAAPAASSEAAIDIRLASGQRLRVRPGCDRQLLAEVIALLEGRPC